MTSLSDPRPSQSSHALHGRAFSNPNTPFLRGAVSNTAGAFLARPYIKSISFPTASLIGICENNGISFRPKIRVTVCNTQLLDPGSVSGYIVLRKGGSNSTIIQINMINPTLAVAAPARACMWGKGVIVTADVCE
jgi:hypothetical protein